MSTTRGATVVLPCIVKNKSGMLQWTRDGFGLGQNRDLHGYNRYTMIGNDEEGNFSLQIVNIHLEDDAVFQCQVGAGRGGSSAIRSKDAKLTVLVPPDPPVIVQGSFLQTTAGMKVNLECESHGGKPAPELKWLDGDKVINDGIVSVSELLSDNKRYNSKVTWSLSPTKDHDGKNFTCRAEHSALDAPLSTSIKLEVKYPPEVSLTVDSVKTNEYDEIKFTCTAVANPNQLIYKWYKNDEIIPGDFTTTLIIPSITREFHGTAISCEVINPVGTSKKTHTLNVHYGPYFKTPPANIPADPGTDITLKCDVEGNPTPNVVWTLDNSKKVIHTKTEMTLSNLDSSKAGRYQCWATVSGFPTILGNYRVLLKGIPQIIADKNQFGIEGESVRVECLIVSVPQPTRVTWSHNDKEIDVERSARFEMIQDPTEDGVLNILTVHEAADSDFGGYNCTVWNAFGQDVMEIKLHKQKSLLLMIILAAVLGGIAIIVSITIVIVLCIRRYHKTPDEDQEPEKQSKTSDQSSNDSDLKVEIRTSSSMSNNGSEPWDENSEDNKQRNTHDVFRYSADYTEPNFPPKEAHNNNGYIPYVDYQRDYNPPALQNGPPYAPQPIANGIDPRYQAGYANPYLRTATSNLPPPHTASTVGLAGGGQMPRPSGTQYITAPQVPLKPGTLATHV